MSGYLTSVVWFRRRDEWFTEEQARSGKLECAVCMKASRKRDLELHHLDYTGVVQAPNGRWVAGEAHEDLVCVHPRCHEWIHRALDNDPAAGAAIDRRTANLRVISLLRRKIIGYLGGLR